MERLLKRLKRLEDLNDVDADETDDALVAEESDVLKRRVADLERENETLRARVYDAPPEDDGAYSNKGGEDLQGRALPHFGALPGDARTLEAVEAELR